MIPGILLSLILNTPALAAPQNTTGAYIEDDDTILPSPTVDFDAYEKARLEHYEKTRHSTWSGSISIEPRAFVKTDTRKPEATNLTAGKAPSSKTLNFTGIIIGIDKHVFKSAGLLSVGFDGGIYSSANVEGYNNGIFGLPALGPTLMYQFNFWKRQPVIPFGKAQYEILYQAFRYEGSGAVYYSRILRFEGGGLINLAFLERRTAGGSLYSDFKIKKVYISGSVTKTIDSAKKNIDLTETSWRAGARFDF